MYFYENCRKLSLITPGRVSSDFRSRITEKIHFETPNFFPTNRQGYTLIDLNERLNQEFYEYRKLENLSLRILLWFCFFSQSYSNIEFK